MKRFFIRAAGLASLLYLLVAYAPRATSQIGYNPEGLRVATGTLTATQVRKLNATPVVVIAAPGSGKAIIVESAQYMLDYGGTAFDSVGAGEDLRLWFGTSNSIVLDNCDALNCLNAAATADAYGFHKGEINTEGYNPDDNQTIEITIASGEWATTDDDSDGNSTIHFNIRYRIITLDLS